MDAANLRSPINGTVAEISDEAGIVVSPSHVSATIIDRSKLYVSISLSDTNIVNIKTGMSANITVTALPDLKLTGKVVEISATGQVSNGVSSYDVKVVLDQAPEECTAERSRRCPGDHGRSPATWLSLLRQFRLTRMVSMSLWLPTAAVNASA